MAGASPITSGPARAPGARLGIGELARRTGVSHRLLRYYEEQGLLSARRTAGGHRTYDAGAPETVRRIRALLDAGLPTRLVATVLPCFDDAGARLDECVAEVLREHVQTLGSRIDDLARQQRQALGLLPL